MSTMTTSQKVAALAATKYHKLPAWMVAEDYHLTDAQAEQITAYLGRCPDKPTPEENVARHEAHQAEQETQRRAAGAVIADITAGFYATPSATGSNDYDFWKVTEGRRPGVRFVKRVVGGGDEKYPRLIEISNREQLAALRAILRAGIAEAADTYAVNQERCKKCGSHLTDEASRAARMGPVCRGER